MWFAAAWSVDRSSLPVGWLGMSGIVLGLHCGLFHLLSCIWRTAGANATPLMLSPFLSASLSEFWGRRWNLAFRDLTHRYLFTPLLRCCGPRGALLTGFLVSGLIHDLVISVPADAGYGGPTAYFLLQGTGLLTERSTWGRALGLGRGWTGRLFAWLIVVAPCGWLFPAPFVCLVILPLLQAMESLL